jgi:uncharacterized membrane protein (DUF2068 family)
LSEEPVNPPADAPSPPAGGGEGSHHKADHSSSVLIVIAIFKLLKATLLIAVALGIHHLLHHDADDILKHWVHAVRIDPENKYIHAGISKVTGLNERTLRDISFGTFAYGTLFLIEGTGLLLRKRWAEYLTVISTTGLLPLEVYELFHRPRPAKVIVLVANVLIVIYLVFQLYRTRKAARGRPSPAA